MKLQWVEARLVAQRLNEVLGVGAWSFEVSQVPGHDNVVKGRLSLPGAVYEDYGYERRAVTPYGDARALRA
jgi:hypothetical protein